MALGDAPAPGAIALQPGQDARSFFSWADNPDYNHHQADCFISDTETVQLPGTGRPLVQHVPIGPEVCFALQVEPIEPANYHPWP